MNVKIDISMLNEKEEALVAVQIEEVFEQLGIEYDYVEHDPKGNYIEWVGVGPIT